MFKWYVYAEEPTKDWIFIKVLTDEQVKKKMETLNLTRYQSTDNIINAFAGHGKHVELHRFKRLEE